jgi:beta-glucosidase
MKISNLHRLLLTGLSICAFHAQGQQSPATVEARVNQILSQMTLDEKLSYIGGTGFFDIKAIPVPNLNVAVNPQIFQTDGPLGVRRNEPSIRFPSGLLLAATWSRDLARDQGISMGRRCTSAGLFFHTWSGHGFLSCTNGWPKFRVHDR